MVNPLTVIDVSKVEWSRSYLWDILINNITIPNAISPFTTSIPNPFNTWFPAVTCNYTKITGNSGTIPYYIRNYQYPAGGDVNNITIAFPDDVYGNLYEWFLAWYTYVYDDSAGICSLYDACLRIDIRKLNLDKSIRKTESYWVYPASPIPEQYDSNSDIKAYTVNLAVVGEIASTNTVQNLPAYSP
jgi:hypothetical protein